MSPIPLDLCACISPLNCKTSISLELWRQTELSLHRHIYEGSCSNGRRLRRTHNKLSKRTDWRGRNSIILIPMWHLRLQSCFISAVTSPPPKKERCVQWNVHTAIWMIDEQDVFLSKKKLKNHFWRKELKHFCQIAPLKDFLIIL